MGPVQVRDLVHGVLSGDDPTRPLPVGHDVEAVVPYHQTTGAITDPMEALVAGVVTDTTKAMYLQDVRRFISELDDLLGLTPSEATFDDILRWWEWKRRLTGKDGKTLYKPGTINRYCVAVRRFYREGARRGLFERNVADGLPSLRVSKEPKGRALTADEASRLLESAPAVGKLIDLRDRLILGFLLLTGCRTTEVCKITMDDLGMDSGHRIITFHRKGGKDDRQKVPDDLSPLIDAWLYRSGVTSGALLRAVYLGDGGEVLRDGVLNRKTVYRIVASRAKKAGLDKVAPHDLRRTYITAADEMGIRLTKIAAAAGHADPETTTRYLHQRDMLINHPSDAVAAWLRGGGDEPSEPNEPVQEDP